VRSPRSGQVFRPRGRLRLRVGATPLTHADRWVWVSMEYATFALGITNGRVSDAPPIARWAIGQDERRVAGFYRAKGAVFRDLPGDET
jgi:hypothetical protein